VTVCSCSRETYRRRIAAKDKSWTTYRYIYTALYLNLYCITHFSYVQVERERGITVKAQTASMIFEDTREGVVGGRYLINLIDTPGHIDFSSEVARSIAHRVGAADSPNSMRIQVAE
jgi:hypothetical protein